MRTLLLALALICLGCSGVPAAVDGGEGGGSAGGGAGGGSADAGRDFGTDAGVDAGADAGIDAGSTVLDAGSNAGTDAGSTVPDAGFCAAPSVGRGLTWVRQNPMFISALSVVMGPPPSSAVFEYFDDFHASGAHLWATGLPTEIDGWLDAGRPGVRYVSWVDQNGNSNANGLPLGGVPPRAGRIGYQIGDEPLDFAQLQTMQLGAAAALAADTSGLTILNLSPDGAKGSLATQGAAMSQFDVLSVDDYTYRKGAYQSLSGLRTAALANGKPYWRYLDGFRFTTQTDNSTESDYRWDAYVGATWGFTGHTWFIYQIEPGNPDLVPSFFTTKGVYGSPRTVQFQWAARLNLQLASLGRTLTLLRSTDVRYVASLLQPAGTNAFTRGAGGDPYLTRVAPPSGTFADVALGFFVDDCGEHYLMVQSQRHQDADFPNSSQANTTFKVDFDFSGASDPTLDRTAVLVLDPVTDVIAVRTLTSTGANTASVDLVLPAGGGVLLKYKDGRSFARQ